MASMQLVAPNLSARDVTGACLRFVQRVYQNRNTYYYRSAWIAWLNAEHKSTGRAMPDVSVPVYFKHFGTYNDGLGQYGDDPARPYYGNWGHIVSWVPGKGFLSSPATGEGQDWYTTIEAVERAFNATYAGWALDVGGLTVATTTTSSTSSTTATAGKKVTMKSFAGRVSRTKPQVITEKEAHVTFLDKHSDSKWGDRTIARGPGLVVAANITVVFEGDPGTRIALRLIRETASGVNVYEYKLQRVTIDTYGRAVATFAVSCDLAKGQLIRVMAKAQKGKKVTVVDFRWDGVTEPGAK